MQLQVAIDTMDKKSVLEFSRKAGKYADIIEIGTPLIYRFGASIIEEVSRVITGAELTADAKIVDAGGLESRIFLEAEADNITLLGGAGKETFQKAEAVVEEFQAGLMVDLIDIAPRFRSERIKQLYRLGVRNFCIHRPHDQKQSREFVLPELTSKKEMKLAVAGGINSDNIREVLDYNPDIIIIGSAIVNADKPLERLRFFKNKLYKN